MNFEFFRDSWPRQVESMARLAEFRFEWVLPGHGERIRLPPGRMYEELRALVGRMRAEERKAPA